MRVNKNYYRVHKWRPHTQDQYDTICQYTEQGIEHVKRVSNYVKDRIHIENNYAKELR